jgi:hypothetical protein
VSVGELEQAGRGAVTGRVVYAYGVLRADSVPPVRAAGVGGGHVRSHTSGKLAALVGDVETPIRAKRRELLGHSDVLNEAAATTTVLPLRFGTTFPDDDALVRELLEPRRAELESLLAELDGRVELLVKAFYREDVVLAEIARSDSRIARLSAATRDRAEAATHAQRLELGTAVARALEATTQADAAEILAELRPLVLDIRVDETSVENQVLRASLLVDRGRVGEVDAAMNRLAERQAARMQFTYAGPLAPYNFVDLESPWAS